MKLHVLPIFLVTAILIFLGSTVSQATHMQPETDHSHTVEPPTHEKRPHVHDELRQIKKWLAEIERDTERRPLFKVTEKEEETFPLQSTRKTQLDGGMTLIIQSTLNNETQFGGDHADGSLSVDMILSSEIRNNGLLIIRGGFMRGEGLSPLPDLFAGGVNADIEYFSGAASDTFHLIEALYEQTWLSETFRLSIGQIDLTSYFDQNQFANSETFQFLSPAFVNNLAIAWGGDVNGYGPGLVLHAHPLKVFEISLGFFGNDGQDIFDEGFWIVEMEYEFYAGDLEGHYRLSYWSNESKQIDGIAVNLDQAFSEKIGVWGRFGIQGGAVEEYDHHISMGLEYKGLPGRSEDVLGIAFGLTWITVEHQKPTGLSGNEHLAEIYYNITVGDGFYLTPDLQYISNPGGNASINPLTIYGFRGQVHF